MFLSSIVRAQPEVMILVAPMRTVGEIDADTQTVMGELIAQALSEDPNNEVLAATEISDVARMASDEGCDNNDCLMEIAGAMGVDHVVVGLLVHNSTSFRLQLGWLEVASLRLRSTQVIEARRLDALSDQLRPALRRLQAGKSSDAKQDLVVDKHERQPRSEHGPAKVDPANRTRQPDAEAKETPIFPLLAVSAVNLLVLGLVGGVATTWVGLQMRDSLVAAQTAREDKDQILALGPWIIVTGSLLSVGLFLGGSTLGCLQLVTAE